MPSNRRLIVVVPAPSGPISATVNIGPSIRSERCRSGLRNGDPRGLWSWGHRLHNALQRFRTAAPNEMLLNEPPRLRVRCGLAGPLPELSNDHLDELLALRRDTH